MKLSLFVLLASSGLVAAAHAHTPLVSSTPADKSSLTAPVKEIAFEFGGDVRLTTVVLTDAGGAKKAVGEVPTVLAAKFAVAIRDELTSGDYVATWRAVGADTHVISGEIHFTVTAPHPH